VALTGNGDTYEFNNINIYQVTPPNSKHSFQINDANHKVEKIALKAVEKILGQNQAQIEQSKYQRAPITNEALITDMFRNNTTGLPRCTDSHYRKALEYVTNLTRPTKPLKTIHFTGTRFYPLNNSGSAELPYVKNPKFKRHILKRFNDGAIANQKLTKGNGINYILTKERVKVHQIKDKILTPQQALYDTRMHARSHLTLSTLPAKIRAVYGVCCTLIFVEIMLLWPFLAHLRASNSFIAWGYETFNGGLERLRREVTGYSYHFSLDFTTFDKLLPFWLIDDIHSIWKSFYDIGPYYEDDPRYPNPSTDPNRILNLWEFLNHGVKHQIFRAPDGSRYARRHSGLPSGLLQTQLLGSFCNVIMVLSALSSIGIDLDDISFKVLGDDGHYSVVFKYQLTQQNLKDVADYCLTHFNAIINVEKSTFNSGSENLQFLSYQFHNGAIRRVHDDLIGKLLLPEHSLMTVETTKSRALGILVANLGYSREIHLICLDILEHLASIDFNHEHFDWYDKQKLDAIFKALRSTLGKCG
jgi:hypothetical protein